MWSRLLAVLVSSLSLTPASLNVEAFKNKLLSFLKLHIYIFDSKTAESTKQQRKVTTCSVPNFFLILILYSAWCNDFHLWPGLTDDAGTQCQPLFWKKNWHRVKLCSTRPMSSYAKILTLFICIIWVWTFS